MRKGYRIIGALLTLAVVVGAVRACQLIREPNSEAGNDQESIDPNEVGLTLRDVTLEQPDENGKPLWRVKGKEVTYSPDQKDAEVKQPDGELFQDGEVIYRVKADRGQIQKNGKVIFLRGNIVATGVKNKAVLRGNELEWRPDDAVMIVRNKVTGTHPQLRAAAQEARVYNRQKRMELLGNVVANTVVKDPKTEPWLKLHGAKLDWFWEAERVESKQPLRVEQFKANKISDIVTGDQGNVALAKKVVTLTQNAALQLLDFPLQVNSDRATWDVGKQMVQVNTPVRVVSPKEKVVLTANQGRFDLAQQVVYLNQNVQAQGERNQSRLNTNTLTWNLKTETVVAEGGVDYQQTDPLVRVTGPRAVGQLKDQTLLVSGGRVVTQIVPTDLPPPKKP